MPKMLIVEDNEINRDLFRRRLERTEDREIVANDGAKGVTKTQVVRVAFALRNRPEPKSSVERYF